MPASLSAAIAPPPLPPPPPPPPPTGTQTALAHEAALRREICALRAANRPDARRVLARLLTRPAAPLGPAVAAGAPARLASSPVLRALRDAVQTRLAAHDGPDLAAYDVALAALDAFVAVRVRGARAKASAFFDQLCTERAWGSLALFGASSVAEAAFLAVNAPRKRLTVIDVAPAYEGRAVAKRLAGATGASVRYGLVANCHRLLEGVDAVVIGAEEVAMNGAVLAAPGAGIVVEVARDLNVVVVVATQAVKYSVAMMVDWCHGGYDVIRPHEISTIVTEMDTGTWGLASAPDVLRRLAGV